MKLIRFGPAGKEKPGIIDGNGNRMDLSGMFSDWDRSFFLNDGLNSLRQYMATAPSLNSISEDVRWGSCVARPAKILCIGLNYSDHAAESGMPIPEEPILFQKAANTVIGPFDAVQIPRNSMKTDWEVELGIIIGRDARYLGSVHEAQDYIAGFCISHDVSERAFQLERGDQWTKGKSCDTFNPLGPFLATPDEINDVHQLEMSLKVNGRQKQAGTTSKMIFNCYYIVHYLSQFMTLEAGDLINTGTPPGVGMGMKPQEYLKLGDYIELSINGLGSQRQICDQA